MPTNQNLQKEYQKARAAFMKRRKQWMTKYHWYVEAPKIPKIITEKSIQRIKDITLSNISEKQAKRYAKQFEIEYEKETPNIFRVPKNRFIDPMTEVEYEQDVQYYEDTHQNYETDPIESEEEIIADLNSLIEGILEQGQTAAYSHEYSSIRAEAFRRIFWDALDKVIDKKAYLHYLEDPTTHARLTEIVTRGIVDSDPKGKQFEDAKAEFATILNLDRPLTVDQSETLTMYDAVGFDFSDTDYE